MNYRGAALVVLALSYASNAVATNDVLTDPRIQLQRRSDETARASLNKLGNPNGEFNTPATCNVPKSVTDKLLAKLGPVRNQGQTGWCYAYTAAELATYATGERVSAAAIAFSDLGEEPDYGGIICRDPRGLAYGGSVDIAFNSSARLSFCPESILPSDIFGSYQHSVLGKFIRKWEGLAGTKKCLDYETSIPTLMGTFSSSELRMGLDNASRRSAMFTVTGVRCYQDGIQSKTRAKDYPLDSSGAEARLRILYALGRLKKGEPVGVSLDVLPFLRLQCTSLGAVGASLLHRELRPKNICDFVEPFTDLASEVYDSSYGHAMTAVGAEYNPRTKKCEMILRNSWGKDCGCFNSDKVSCKDGYVRIPIDSIPTKDASLTFLE
jgi:hypothetical protein